jgi:rubrerythrin
MPAIDVPNLSLRDALDLAISMEEEAQRRYEEFARITGGRYAGDAGDMFRQMAGYEERHRAELAARRSHLFGDAPRRITADQLDDLEAPDRGSPRTFMSARQALEVALASEEKAWSFFADALPHLVNREVRVLFEDLRDEEERHANLVRSRLERLPPGPDLEEDEADAPGSDPG